MKKTLFLILTATTFATTGLAQRQAPVHDLNRAGAVFRTADANHNGVLSVAEARRQGLERAQFQAFDANANGAIDQNEFMVAFRRMTLDKGGRVADDLDKEVTRIMAKRKAEAEKRAAEERAKEARKKQIRKQDARKKDARKKDADKPVERVPKRGDERPVQRPRTPRG